MAKQEEEITLTSEQEAIVKSFLKKYPEASRFTAIKFCFGRKFELNRIYPLYESYRQIVKEKKLDGVTVSTILSELRTQKMYIPGTRDKKGSALFVVQAAKHVIGQFPAENTIKMAYYLGECITANLKTQRNGITIIIDLSGTEWSNFDPNFMAEIIGFFQNHIPAAIKNILIWHAPWWIKTAIKIVSPFLKEKMRKRIQICDNLFALKQFVSVADLPVEFGGTLQYDHEYFIKREVSKLSNENIFSSLTDWKNLDTEAFESRQTLEMYGASCALSPNLEASLQKERDESIAKIDEEIVEFFNTSNGNNNNNNVEYSYPVPVYDLMQSRALRLTLDVTADFRPLSGTIKPTNSIIQSAWNRAQYIDDGAKRLKIIKKTILNEGNDNYI